MEDAKQALIRLTNSYPQRSMIFYSQSKRKNADTLKQIQAMTNSFPIQSVQIKATRNGNFAHYLLSRIQELIDNFYSDDNSQRQQQTLLTLESAAESKADLALLTDIFLDLGSMAKRSGQSICLFIDNMHCMKKDEAEALTMAIHRSNQVRIPLMIFGAGLPSVLTLLGNACPYAETLFMYSEASSQITSKDEWSDDLK